jgi:hypothetical protein
MLRSKEKVRQIPIAVLKLSRKFQVQTGMATRPPAIPGVFLFPCHPKRFARLPGPFALSRWKLQTIKKGLEISSDGSTPRFHPVSDLPTKTRFSLPETNSFPSSFPKVSMFPTHTRKNGNFDPGRRPWHHRRSVFGVRRLAVPRLPGEGGLVFGVRSPGRPVYAPLLPAEVWIYQ